MEGSFSARWMTCLVFRYFQNGVGGTVLFRTVPTTPFWKFMLGISTCLPCHIPDRWSRGANCILTRSRLRFRPRDLGTRSGNMNVSEMLETMRENDLFVIFPEFFTVITGTSCSAERSFSAGLQCVAPIENLPTQHHETTTCQQHCTY